MLWQVIKHGAKITVAKMKTQVTIVINAKNAGATSMGTRNRTVTCQQTETHACGRRDNKAPATRLSRAGRHGIDADAMATRHPQQDCHVPAGME